MSDEQWCRELQARRALEALTLAASDLKKARNIGLADSVIHFLEIDLQAATEKYLEFRK